jgi:hypothetical protein
MWSITCSRVVRSAAASQAFIVSPNAGAAWRNRSASPTPFEAVRRALGDEVAHEHRMLTRRDVVVEQAEAGPVGDVAELDGDGPTRRRAAGAIASAILAAIARASAMRAAGSSMPATCGFSTSHTMRRRPHPAARCG